MTEDSHEEWFIHNDVRIVSEEVYVIRLADVANFTAPMTFGLLSEDAHTKQFSKVAEEADREIEEWNEILQRAKEL